MFVPVLIFLSTFGSVYASTPVKIKILVVPGHDDVDYGTHYKKIKEADMTLRLSELLVKELKKDKRFAVYVARDKAGYTAPIEDFFRDHHDEILSYMTVSKSAYAGQFESGQIESISSVPHNNASQQIAEKLYGINLWANQNKMDLVIHIHFNDESGRDNDKRGEYKGFAVYMPEKQLDNAKPSSAVAMRVFSELYKKYQPSTMEKESAGIVFDQSLIAVAGRNAIDTRRFLVEYGYVYEKRFSTAKKREVEYKVMARQTYAGIRKYFDSLETKKK